MQDVAGEQIDLVTALSIVAAFNDVSRHDAVIDRLLQTVMEHGAAERAMVFTASPEGGFVAALARGCDHGFEIQYQTDAAPIPPRSVINLLAGCDTTQSLADHAALTATLTSEYVRDAGVRNALVLPLATQHGSAGTLYIENWHGRLPVFTLIAATGAAALAHAACLTAMETVVAQAGRSEEAITTTLGKIPAIIAVTGSDGGVEFMSPVWSAYTGLDASASMGAGWLDSVHPVDQPALAANWERRFDRAVPQEYEARIRRHDGVYRWFMFNSRPSRNDAGEVDRWYGTAVDIDDAKSAQLAIDDLQAKLSHASRIASLGELTASIAHEIRQPLAAVLANAEAGLRWLSRLQPDLTEAGMALDRIRQNADRMDDVITRLRQLFGNSLRRHEPFDLAEAVGEVVAFLQAEARKHDVTLAFAPAGTALIVRADRVQIQQVILNLLTNALQATTGAPLRRIDITGRSQPGHVTIAVADTGCGISLDDAQTCFVSFKTTKADGMGLGLSISRSIVEDHGGRIWGEPNAPIGAVFGFELPRFE